MLCCITLIVIILFSTTVHGETQSGHECQDFDHTACVAMAKQHVNVCSDPVLSATACPVFCNRCHIGHWSEWSSWGSCSNGGIKKRSRTCSITDNSQWNMSSLCINGSIEYDRSYCNNPSCMPPKIVNLTMTGSLEIGQIAMLHCEVFGNPIPLIDWQILNTSGIYTEIHGDYHEVLKIGPHAQFQSNVFKCRAINRCGSTESSVFFAQTASTPIIG